MCACTDWKRVSCKEGLSTRALGCLSPASLLSGPLSAPSSLPDTWYSPDMALRRQESAERRRYPVAARLCGRLCACGCRRASQLACGVAWWLGLLHRAACPAVLETLGSQPTKLRWDVTHDYSALAWVFSKNTSSCSFTLASCSVSVEQPQLCRQL